VALDSGPARPARAAGGTGLAAADRVVLLADATKIPGTGVGRVCGPKDLHTVVTTTGADTDSCRALREAGVEVITA